MSIFIISTVNNIVDIGKVIYEYDIYYSIMDIPNNSLFLSFFDARTHTHKIYTNKLIENI